jgi:pyrroloquinoline quinone biosynthesis protein E
MGVLHVHFSGGEPLLYRDLPALVACAREQGMYTNLITSGLGLTRSRLHALRVAGLESIQISLQADRAELADRVAGTSAHKRKLIAARLVSESGIALSLNVVLHRANIERLEGIVALAEQLGAQRLELAHAQYLGWAYLNREALLPTRFQVENATQQARAAIKRLRGRMEIVYVLPDYYSERPKPCMHGWGQRSLAINPIGQVLPCQTASSIPDLHFETVREHRLDWIWRASTAFQRFRGTDWLPAPCQSCAFRETDFGGCRCQAFLLTGDAAQTDPVCQFAPRHHDLQSIVARLQIESASDWQKRANPLKASRT